MVLETPETRYAKMADGNHVAYQVVGTGDLDIVFVTVSGNIELAWEVPPYARVLRRLASFGRLIRYDQRGLGLSDPLASWEIPSLEERTKELLAVLDAAGSERAALIANNVLGLLAIFFAASYPNRTSALVLHGCYARFAEAPDYPFGAPRPILDRAVARVVPEGDYAGEFLGLRYIAPYALRDPEFVKMWGRLVRSATNPATARRMADQHMFTDVRAVLPAIQAPTMVLYRHRDRFAGKPHAKYLAEHISGAKLVELAGEDNLIFSGDNDPDLDEIEEFLTGTRHAPDTDRVLATVLFTDIVRSTERVAAVGDQRWKELLDSHDQAVRRQLERFGGREVNTVGDGFLATFDGPGRAIHCALAIRDVVKALGVEMRAGLHTGEVELRSNDLAGMSVHIAARVSALSRAGEVLVSSTVRDLVTGSGLEFEDRSEHELKGVPGTWKLFAVKA